MGAVLDARDQKFGRSVAMKVMLRRQASEEEEQRFLQEARVLGQLAHPNIVPVYDLGFDHERRMFYTMKLVQGGTLHEVISKLKTGDSETLARYPLNTLLTIFQKVCDAVAFAHSRGIIHRDLKPHNVMVGEFGEVLVMDWGLAKILSGSPAAEEAARTLPFSGGAGLARGAADEQATVIGPGGGAPEEQATVLGPGGIPQPNAAPRIPPPIPADRSVEIAASAGAFATIEGAVMGTPHYMSPEQAAGKNAELDARSDIFSLGGILYALLTLRPPVEGDSQEEVLSKVRSGTIMPPTSFNAPTSFRHQAPAASTGAVVEPKKIITLPHCPGGKVPGALSAVTMKALTRDKTRRYQSVTQFTADIVAYQGGFATSAENANALQELRLFILRHKAMAAATLLIVLLTIGFVAKVMSSEKKARNNAERAETNAQTARDNEAKAKAAQVKMLEEMQDRLITLANDEVTKGNVSVALPMLAKMLRENPANRLAANRLLSLTQGEWPLLLADEKTATEPFRLGKETSPDGTRKLVVKGTAVEILDARTGQQMGEPLKHPADVLSAQFSPDGQRVLTVALGGMHVWDALTGQPLGEPLTRSSAPGVFSADGRFVLLGAENNPKQIGEIWDARAGVPLHDSLKQARNVQHAQFSSDGQRVLVVTWDNTARVWDALTGQPTGEILKHAEAIRAAQFSPDGQQVVTASDDTTARLWDARTGQPMGEPLQHAKSVKSAQFSRDGKFVVTASGDTTARVWEARTGQAIGEPLPHAAGVRSAQFSPDGKWLATLSDDWTVTIRDARTSQRVGQPLKHAAVIVSAQFSPDSQLVVTASDDSTARVWDARTGQPLGEPLKHAKTVTSARFSPDGKSVVTASADTTARIWEVGTGRPISEPLKHANVIASAQFSPDSQRIVTASYDTTARVWDARTGQPISEPLKHPNGVESAQFSADGQRVLTTSADTVARIWDLPVAPEVAPTWLVALAEAVAGQRLGARNLTEPVSPKAFLQLRAQLLQTPDSAPLGRWVKWFLADRSTRTISPFSALSVPDHVRRLVDENTLESLREATRLDPTNGLAYARLAKAILAADPEKNPRTIAEADFLSRHSLKWAPTDPEVKRLREEIAAAVKIPVPK